MPRPTGVTKLSNGYVEAVDRDFYIAIPKSVWAAIAISALTNGGQNLDLAESRIAHEWDILHRNGIVPQTLDKLARSKL